jgi:hypothetical protein
MNNSSRHDIHFRHLIPSELHTYRADRPAPVDKRRTLSMANNRLSLEAFHQLLVSAVLAYNHGLKSKSD